MLDFLLRVEMYLFDAESQKIAARVIKRIYLNRLRKWAKAVPVSGLQVLPQSWQR